MFKYLKTNVFKSIAKSTKIQARKTLTYQNIPLPTSIIIFGWNVTQWDESNLHRQGNLVLLRIDPLDE